MNMGSHFEEAVTDPPADTLPQNKQCSAHDGMSRRGSCVPDARTLKRPPEDWLVVNTLGTLE